MLKREKRCLIDPENIYLFIQSGLCHESPFIVH